MQIRLLKTEKGLWRMELEESSREEDHVLESALQMIYNVVRPLEEGMAGFGEEADPPQDIETRACVDKVGRRIRLGKKKVHKVEKIYEVRG